MEAPDPPPGQAIGAGQAGAAAPGSTPGGRLADGRYPRRYRQRGNSITGTFCRGSVSEDPASPAGEPALSLRLFGGFELRAGGRPLRDLRSRSEQWLLALLALRSDRDTDRDWLAETLWPDSKPERALFYLRRGLSDLRSSLEGQAERLQSPTLRSLHLDLSGADCDALRFDGAIVRGDRASLEEAVSLYRGALLPECQQEWVAVERGRREQAYLGALELLAERAVAEGDLHAALHYLKEALLVEPLRESLHCRLMEALALNGDYAAAGEAYRDLRLLLHRELNTAPAAETAALFARIRTAARQPAPHPRPPAPGPHPGPAAICVPQGCVPQPLSSLVGREQERKEVKALIAASRLTTLTGTGGVGKTRLAIQLLDELAGDYPHGAWFVDLSALSEPEQAVGAVAAVLGVREEPGRPLVETLVETLRSRRLLLALDNCEHLLDASARLAERLLLECPELRVLATSREALRVPGETAWRVPSLAVPDLRVLAVDEGALPALLDYEAVRLFSERAAQAQPEFRPNPAILRTVAEICLRLDGIPLAIELAAARLRTLSIHELEARLDDRFRLLTGGSRTALPRQQTLRAAMDWSYNLLTEPERALLRRLSVFAGGCTLEAAEWVCGSTEAWECGSGISSLVEKSLVLYGPAEERYRLLESVRQYAAEHLAQCGEECAVRRRHRDYYLNIAGETAQRRPDTGGLEGLDALAMEQENLRAALAWCLAEEPETGLRLAISLDGFWRWRSRLGEGCEWLLRLLAAWPAPGGELQAKAYLRLAVWTEWRGAFAAAAGWYRRALAVARSSGEVMQTFLALFGLGLVCRQQGDYRQAAAFVEESAAVARDAGMDRDCLRARTELGSICHCLGDDERANGVLTDCLDLARRLGDPRLIAVALDALGDLALDRADYACARAFYMEKLALVRAAGIQELVVYSINDLGLLAWRVGDLSGAGACIEEALAVARHAGSPMLQTICLLHLAALAYRRGDLESLRPAARESLELAWEAQEMGRVVPALHRLAALAAATADSARAARLLAAADRIEESHGPVTLFGERAFRSELLALIRSTLDEPPFLAAQAEGGALPVEQSVRDALRWAASPA